MGKEQSLLELQKLKETELVKSIILPLLEKFGYSTVEHRHGPMEKGIDILCIKQDELNENDVLAIQVKKLKFSGNYQKDGQIHNISHQLEASKTEEIPLKDGTHVKANRVWFISPYPMNVNALLSAFNKVRALREAQVKIIDGDKLYDLLAQKAPELLLRLGDEGMAYIERFKKEVPILQEALSFKIQDKEHLSKQYVKMYLALLPARLKYLYFDKFKLSVGREIDSDPTLLDSVNTFNQISSDLLTVPLLETKKDIYDKLNVYPIKKNFHNVLVTRIREEISSLKQSLQSSIEKGGDALKQYFDVIAKLQTLVEHDGYHFLGAITPNQQEQIYFDIEIDQIIRSRVNYQVIADAGSGKTTLLRMIGFHSIRLNRIPVFVPLITRSKNQSLFDIIKKTCNNLGLNINEEALTNKLKKGELLILFDGIDEAISKIKTIQSDILDFIKTYPNTQFIISTRQWAAITNYNSFLSIRLLPFTKEQVNTFFRNWFATEPHKAEEIISHLRENTNLYNIVSTPLVATIIAAIKMHGKQLPNNLIEVYNQRLELLLHDWDNIKGVKRDFFDSRDKLIFLRRFAFMLHSKHIRWISWSEMINFAINNVGDINDKKTATEFISELIYNNNVIFKDISNKWGLGHLQYQEYLAALELKENPNINKADYLGDGWWTIVLVNYALLTRDISALIQDALVKNKASTYINILFDLLSFAPNTNKKLKKYLLDGNGVAKMVKVIRNNATYTDEFLSQFDYDDDDYNFDY